MNLLKKVCSFLMCAALLLTAADIPVIYAEDTDTNIYYSSGKSYEDAVKYAAKCLESCPDSIDLRKYKLSSDEMEYLINDILLSRPDIFYVSPVYSYALDTRKKTNNVMYLYPQYIYSKTSIPKKRREMEKEADEILSGLDMSLPDELKALYLHDKLALKMEYKEENEIRSAYEGLVKEKALCVAYALAYKYLADKAGLTCICAISTDIEHCWNMVKINGRWYNVDVTYDDPYPDVYGNISHDFFLVSDDVSGMDYSNKDFGYSADDDSFENEAWQNSDSQIIILDGKYIYSDTRRMGVYSHDYKRKVSDKLFGINDYWVRSDNKTYTVNFSRLEYFGDRIYFSTPDKIKSYSLRDENIRTEYTAELSEGDSVYGMKLEDGVVYVQSASRVDTLSKNTFKAFNVRHFLHSTLPLISWEK